MPLMRGTSRVKAEVAGRYGALHGIRGQFEDSLGCIEPAIEIYAGLGADIQQGRLMASFGRCYSARAGRLERSFHFAARARAIADVRGDLSLRSWLAMEAEPCFYKGLWQRTVDIVEQDLPPAWEIGNWAEFCGALRGRPSPRLSLATARAPAYGWKRR